MLGGAVVGEVSSYVGGVIAGAGGFMSNTLGIMYSSFFNSVGTTMYTAGQTSVSVSFGVASYDLSNNEWGYLGKKEMNGIKIWLILLEQWRIYKI